jgi:hypothetical protein
MMRRLGFLLFLWGASLSCASVLACSNSGSPSAPLGSDGGAPLPASVTQGLQQLVSQGQKYAGVPTDPTTSKVAAQIVQLLYDRASSLATAGNIEAIEADPGYTGNKTLLETSRQASLARAASDLTQVQALQKSSGSATLNADGGAVNVINAIVVQAFSARASAILASTGAPPSADSVSNFLQEVAVVLGDQGNDGHDVAAQLVVQAILSDAGLVRTDAGVP